jgi:hypothetical protein
MDGMACMLQPREEWICWVSPQNYKILSKICEIIELRNYEAIQLRQIWTLDIFSGKKIIDYMSN